MTECYCCLESHVRPWNPLYKVCRCSVAHYACIQDWRSRQQGNHDTCTSCTGEYQFPSTFLDEYQVMIPMEPVPPFEAIEGRVQTLGYRIKANVQHLLRGLKTYHFYREYVDTGRKEHFAKFYQRSDRFDRPLTAEHMTIRSKYDFFILFTTDDGLLRLWAVNQKSMCLLRAFVYLGVWFEDKLR